MRTINLLAPRALTGMLTCTLTGTLTLVLLASCSSPPKPPTVDESRKRPANTATAVELQGCMNELQNTRQQAKEAGRLADAATAATAATVAATATATAAAAAAATARLASLTARQQMLDNLRLSGEQQPRGNSVYTIRFEFGSSRVDIPTDAARPLVDAARGAALVMLRGRTDGVSASAAESRIARDRATAVRDYLVAAGVEPAHIRATYQPTGDHVVDNVDASGRALNRRVEIEIYRSLPIATGIGTAVR